MKNPLFLLLVSLCLVSCKKSLQDQAEKEAYDFTRKYCPTPIIGNERTDSMTFDKNTKTIVYWKSLYNEADDKNLIVAQHDKLRNALLQSLSNETRVRNYMKEDFRFRYVYHSGSHPKETIFDVTFTPKDYR